MLERGAASLSNTRRTILMAALTPFLLTPAEKAVVDTFLGVLPQILIA